MSSDSGTTHCMNRTSPMSLLSALSQKPLLHGQFSAAAVLPASSVVRVPTLLLPTIPWIYCAKRSRFITFSYGRVTGAAVVWSNHHLCSDGRRSYPCAVARCRDCAPSDCGVCVFLDVDCNTVTCTRFAHLSYPKLTTFTVVACSRTVA